MALLGRDDTRQAQRVRAPAAPLGAVGAVGAVGEVGAVCWATATAAVRCQSRRRGEGRRCDEAQHAGDPSSGSTTGLCRLFPAAGGGE